MGNVDPDSSYTSQTTPHSVGTETTACSSFANPPAATSTNARRESIKSSSSTNTRSKLAQCLGVCRGCNMQ